MTWPDELEASLEAEYGYDVLGKWLRGDMSSRKFLVLVTGLPHDSWFKTTAQADAEQAEKDAEQARIAALYDRNMNELTRRR